MTTQEAKVALRKRVRVLKLSLDRGTMEAEASAVFAQLEQLPEFQRASTVLCYWAMDDELPTQQFIKKWCGEKRILLPVVAGDDLLLKEYTGEACLQREPPFGIKEPKGTAVVPGVEVDFAIVPGVAFDALGRRLGRGRGFYDRVFGSMPQAMLVGVGLSVQLAEQIPTEEHDRTMGLVVVPQGVLRP